MKIFYSLFIFSFLFISPILIGQSACEQFISAVKKSNHGQNKNRSYRMTMQSTDDVRTNITEADSLGRIHFFGNIGSLRIESYEAEKKRYAKIISEYLVNDDWTWREVKANDALSTLWFDIAGRNLQINDCQVIGEEILQQKKCHILSYYILLYSILSYPILCILILSYFLLIYHYSILFYLILSCSFLFYINLSYLILFN